MCQNLALTHFFLLFIIISHLFLKNMKQTTILLTMLLVTMTLWSQEKKRQYLFPDFSDSYIYYKDGKVFQVPTNYDLFKNKFFFIDKDNEKKEFTDPDMIVSIKMDDRTFRQLSDEDVAEVIQAEPLILVQYLGKTRIKKQLSMGGRTETASVDSYTNTYTYGVGDDTRNIELIKTEYQFYIEKNKRLKRFSTEKQFLKLYPKQKELLKKYIDENKVDFNSIEQVTKLCNHAFSIEK